MKRIFTLVACTLLLLASCKKEKVGTPTNYVTADVEGVAVTFNVNNLAQVSNKPSVNLIAPYKLYIYGANRRDENSDAIAINLTWKQPIAKGSYTGSSDDYDNVSISYITGPFSATSPNQYNSDPSDGGMGVTITSMTDKNIQGTFRGQLNSNGKSVRISNGKFNLDFN